MTLNNIFCPKISESLDSVASLAPIMDSVRQRRKEEATATREKISEIRKRMKVQAAGDNVK